MPGSAGPPRPKLRVIQIEPSFFGNPWIQPRVSAKSRSTQMYEHVVTSSPSSSALTTMKNSLYWERDGSTSSSPPSRARLPVGDDEGAAAGVGVRVEPVGEEGDGLVRVGPVVDDEEGADVVPRRVRHEGGAALRRPRDREALQRAHLGHPSGGGGSGAPRVSQLSRSDSTATGSNRKYERGGSGPHVFDE